MQYRSPRTKQIRRYGISVEIANEYNLKPGAPGPNAESDLLLAIENIKCETAGR